MLNNIKHLIRQYNFKTTARKNEKSEYTLFSFI